MIRWLILVALLLYRKGETNSFPIHVIGNKSAVETLVWVLNREAQPFSPVQARLINSSTNEYGIFLLHRMNNQGWTTRENRFQCALNYLLGDSLKTLNLILVENDPAVLISNGKKSTIDIADIERFNNDSDGSFTSFNVLLHELYEQYQLQVVEGLHLGKITNEQLGKAHLKAVQKESNFYSLTMLRTEADVKEEYIHIEFTDRVDSSRHHYYAYFQNGNIEHVERQTNNDSKVYSKN